MKIIEQTYEIIPQEGGLNGIYKQIEIAGRTCYKSEDRITEDSAKKFVDKIIKLGHYSVLEHGTVYLKIHWSCEIDYLFYHAENIFTNNHYSIVITHIEEDFDSDLCPTLYITTNYRVLVENFSNIEMEELLKYVCEPTLHDRRITTRFILSRSVAQQFTRHRAFSFSMESQRYCNYSKNKFDNEITFIKPFWMSKKDIDSYLSNIDVTFDIISVLDCMALSEITYLNLIKRCGKTPEQARVVLPNSTKTELIMTGFNNDWKKFFDLRCSDKADPQTKRLARALMNEYLESITVIEINTNKEGK